jgi:hypothetical protein
LFPAIKNGGVRVEDVLQIGMIREQFETVLALQQVLRSDARLQDAKGFSLYGWPFAFGGGERSRNKR